MPDRSLTFELVLGNEEHQSLLDGLATRVLFPSPECLFVHFHGGTAVVAVF